MNMTQDKKQMAAFKQFFHGNNTTYFQTISKTTSKTHFPKHFRGKLSKRIFAELIESNDAKMEIAMMINTSDGEGRSATNVCGITALFLDLDDRSMSLKDIKSLPIPPHMIVETSPGKWHAYWRINRCPVKKFSLAIKALAKMYGGDLNVCDSSRVMRMPGTINWKYDDPYLARIVHIDERAKPIALRSFVRRMKLEIEQTAPPILGRAGLNQPKAAGLTDEQEGELRKRLAVLPADNREIWMRIGMAIHSIDQSNRGYDLWTNWSKKSGKFDENGQRDAWRNFKADRAIGIGTLYFLTGKELINSAQSVDEMSLAEIFADSNCDSLRYDPMAKRWYHFSGVVWRRDDQAPLRLARTMVVDLNRAATSETLKKAIAKFRSASALRAIVSHAELLDRLHVCEERFDKAHSLIATVSDVIDLRTGCKHAIRPSDYLRRTVAVQFDEKAQCPEWEKFMHAVTCGREELYRYIQRALGYTLFGHANLQQFFLIVGKGGNGKGVMMRTIKELLGEYSQSVAPNLLTTAFSGNANAPSPSLAQLHGARMVICTELPTGKRLDDAFVKQFAGGDEITARHSYGSTFTFKPEGKLWLSTNEIPDIASHDEAMWRRLVPIPFDAKFTDKNRDVTLDEKLRREHPGILNWLLEGAKRFAEAGELGRCDEIDELIGVLRVQADSVLGWLRSCCKKSSEGRTPASIAYDSYVAYSRRAGRKPLTNPVFLASLERRKGISHQRGRDCNYYRGFILKIDG